MPRNKTFSLAKSLAASAFAIASLGGALSTPAHATPITYTLDINGCSSGCGTGPYGTVTVDQNTSNTNAVDVSVSLNAGYVFRHANDPNHHAFAFNLAGSPGITIGNIQSHNAANVDTSAAFSLLAGTSFSNSPFGTFEYAFDCTTGGGATCAVGYNVNNPTFLSFVITPATGALTAADFIASTGNGTHVVFAADINNDGSCAGCSRGSTGNVGANGPRTPIPPNAVPEPVSSLLLAIGLAGLGFSRRKLA